jgi:hypothetical protein
MREDMAKVIVERPRCGSWMRARHRKGYHRRQQQIAPGDEPKRERIKEAYGASSKYLNEHLAPLRRFLRSNVGRPWDKVFSEICARINRNSAVQDHVRDHVFDFVETDVILIDGVLCFGSGYRYGRPLEPYYRWLEFYVCPKTGLLRQMKQRKVKPEPSKAAPKPIPMPDQHYCVWIEGGWHLAEVEPFRKYSVGGWVHYEQVMRNDAVLGRAITAKEGKQYYGRAVFATSKRRIANRELAQYPIPARERVVK